MTTTVQNQQSTNNSSSGNVNSSNVNSASSSAPSNSYPSMQMQPTAIPIYIGNLHNEVNESHLFSFVSSIGIQPVSARVCTNSETKKSLNYGYINFQSKEDAETAMSALNYTLLFDRPVRMMQSQRDPSSRRSGKGNIIIKGLPKSVTHRLLFDTMTEIGKVHSVSMKRDLENPDTQNAYVQFEKEEHSKVAVGALRDAKIEGSHVSVALFKPQKDEYERTNMHEDTFVNCYVKNLPKNKIRTDEDLMNLFKTFGDITSCKVALDVTGLPTGAGFVCFKDHESAVRAVEEGTNLLLDDDSSDVKKEGSDSDSQNKTKPLIVTRFMRKNERVQVLKEKYDSPKSSSLGSKSPVGRNNVYVKNLHTSVTDQILYDEFKKFGNIISAKVMMNDSGTSRGFGFVSFATAEEAEDAIKAKHSTYFYTKPLQCFVAQKKAERLATLRAQFKTYPYNMQGSHPGMPYYMKTPTSYYPQNYMSYASAASNYPPIYAQMQQHMVNSGIADNHVMNSKSHYHNQMMHNSSGRVMSHQNYGNSVSSSDHSRNAAPNANDSSALNRSMNKMSASSNAANASNSMASGNMRQPHSTSNPNSSSQSSNYTDKSYGPSAEKKDYAGKQFLSRLAKSDNPGVVGNMNSIAGAMMSMNWDLVQEILSYNDADFNTAAEKVYEHMLQSLNKN